MHGFSSPQEIKKEKLKEPIKKQASGPVVSELANKLGNIQLGPAPKAHARGELIIGHPCSSIRYEELYGVRSV